jgi:GNAT superfamily N-acetyltransferase
MYKIRPASKADIPAIIGLWRVARPYDGIRRDSVESFFADSSHYQPEAALVAEADDGIAGFIIGVVREKAGMIPVFCVRPQDLGGGVADALLDKLTSFFEEQGLTVAEAGTAWESGLSKCGYDTRYVDILEVFERNGFKKVWSDEELDGDIEKDLVRFEIPDWASDARAALHAEGFTFSMCEPDMKDMYLRFMEDHFGGYKGWVQMAKEYVGGARETAFHLLAFRGDDVVGFTQCRFRRMWQIDATGVRKGLRRKKIGGVLVFLALEEMKRRGAERMCIGECPLDFYHIVGGEVMRRYQILRKALGGG